LNNILEKNQTYISNYFRVAVVLRTPLLLEVHTATRSQFSFCQLPRFGKMKIIIN